MPVIFVKMQHQKHLIVIGGATATGKTAMAVRVAKHFGAAVISADSRQFYREMSIGTAKPTAAEMDGVPHHFIGSVSVGQPFTVGDFEEQALELLRVIFEKNNVAVLVGGSGLFVRALCEGLDEFPEVPKQVVADLQQILDSQGIASLQNELKLADPAYHAQVDLNNPHRLIRALSVCRASGRPFSSFRLNEKKPRFFDPIYTVLEVERPILYEKINLRVEAMMAAGLLEEARQLYPLRNLTALQTVGYQELFDFFDGKCSLEEAVALIKQNSRRYAKRQSTWFRKDKHWERFGPAETERLIGFAEQKIKDEA
jgi:tRNA dimethylallyltransferase